jgi:hypothetical protein
MGPPSPKSLHSPERGFGGQISATIIPEKNWRKAMTDREKIFLTHLSSCAG